MNIHLFLVENIGEIAGFVLVVGSGIIAGMFITRTTTTELMVLGVSLYRSFRVSWQHQAQRRAAQRQLAIQKRAEAAARISVARPAAIEVGRTPVLASGDARQQALPLSQEPMVRVGGQVVSAGSINAPASPLPTPADTGRPNPLRGLLKRLPMRGAAKPEAAPALAAPQISSAQAQPVLAGPPPAPAAQPTAVTAAPPPPPPPPAPAQTGAPLAARPTPDGPSVAANTPIELPKQTPVVHSTTPKQDYVVPEFRQVLNPGSKADYDRKALVERARIIQETLESFGAPGKVVEINTGPVITQFGVEPGYVMQRDRQSRVKVSAIAQLDKDLQLALGARSIRIEAPVPGKGYVGIEVPNDTPVTVSLRDVLESNRYQRLKSPLAIALGESVDGTPVAADLASMPHLLIAGTTGSGKSVCVNAIIASLLLRNTPEQVKFIMVDPKRVELTGYNGIPHLIAPVVVEVERIIGVLKWLTREMDDRYKKFSVAGARNIEDYNRNRDPNSEAMPYIVTIIDELADLMMLAPEEAERYITRIAAMARATGIHLVIATQRPSADVVTGLIKANFPARIAFAVAGNVDSRVILDQPGAEKLLGRGDMLYLSADSPSAQRLQGVFVSDSELSSIIRYWKAQTAGQPQKPTLTFGAEADDKAGARPQVASQQRPPAAPAVGAPSRGLFDDLDEDEDADYEDDDAGIDDELFERAVELVRRQNGASVSLLQRKMRIGYARAARLIDAMEERGIIGPQKEGSSKQRDVLR
jgi:S-DNA-T family DNA segregation ATPase FtsK/SpoIIIE